MHEVMISSGYSVKQHSKITTASWKADWLKHGHSKKESYPQRGGVHNRKNERVVNIKAFLPRMVENKSRAQHEIVNLRYMEEVNWQY